jgi:ArsR family transcriptional regulator
MMREFVNITKALADKNRVRMVLALQGRELCACQLNELFGLAASTMCKHLSILCQSGLVNSRKDGRWVYYSLPRNEAPLAVRKALEWISESLAENSQINRDTQQLNRVLKMNPSELCKRQCRN